MINIVFDNGTKNDLKDVSWVSSEILFIDLHLQYGLLSEPLNLAEHSEYILKEVTPLYNEELKESVKNSRELLSLNETEAVCIWYTESYSSKILGFYYICSLLKNKNNRIFIQKFPSNIYRNMKGWLEVNSHFIELQRDNCRELSLEEKFRAENRWLELCSEKANLRILKDNQVISVKETYFDEKLKKLYSECSGNTDFVIGKLYENFNDSIDSYWLENRLKKIMR